VLGLGSSTPTLLVIYQKRRFIAMKILSYVELTEAQKKTLEAMEDVTVRPFISRKTVMATFRTFQAQNLKVELDADGVIVSTEVHIDSL